MRQSDRVKAAAARALDRLTRISKEELDHRFAQKEVGPVGHLLLETGTLALRYIISEPAWGLGDSLQLKATGRFFATYGVAYCAADTDVRFPYHSSTQGLHGLWLELSDSAISFSTKEHLEEEVCAKAA